MKSTTQDRPPRGHGHYNEDGTRWWDDDQGRWFPTVADVDTLEIEVEDQGHTSMLRSIATTLTGQHGTQSYRFVARARCADPRWAEFTIPSGTFPVQPLQLPIEDVGPDDAWGDEMSARLAELDQELRAEGWEPAGQGEHWWSHRYTRPALDYDAPATS